MDSALRTAWEEKDAKVCATLFGLVGVENEPPSPPPGDSSLLFLIASACLLGGPRLLLGLSKVQGISSALHARHGGPDSSHYRQNGSVFLFGRVRVKSYLDFTDTAGVASFAQTISLLSFTSAGRRWWRN